MPASVLMRVFGTAVVLLSFAQAAPAIPPFWEEFEKSHDPLPENFKTAKCNVCHIPDKPKKEHNAFGLQVKKYLQKADFTKDKIDADPDAAGQKIREGIQKAEQETAKDEKKWGDVIKEGQLPTEFLPVEAPADMPVDNPSTTETPDGEVPAADTPEVTTARAKVESAGGSVFRVAINSSDLDVAFHLSSAEVGDAALESVPALPNVISLNLRGTKITDAALQHVGKVTSLQKLHLEKTSITDEGLKQLGGLSNLTYLNLYGTGVTDAGLAHLHGLKNLKSIYLFESKVTDEGVKKLQEAIPELKIIR